MLLVGVLMRAMFAAALGTLANVVRTLVRFTVIILVAGIALAAGLGLLAPNLRALAAAGSTPSSLVSDLRPLAARSVVYARDGSVLAVLHAEEDRDPAVLAEMPEPLVHAIVDTEDRSFYRHAGFDLRATMRALLVNARSGDVEQGGSTITQQLVKNSLLTPERSLDRKVREAVLAVRLESELGKADILERYLNTVYFGDGAYGVRAGAERFFGKELRDVTVDEAALLAAQIANPERYDPFTHSDAARARRRRVLEHMVTEGHLARADAERYAEMPLPDAPSNPLPKPDSYFVEEVKRRLLRDTRLGDTYQDRYQRVFRGGLRIHTTLDPRMQRLAESAVEAILPKSPFTAAVVAMDPTSGDVRALVGGPNFEKAKYNLVTQGQRQPGSAFKMVTLAAALENGYSVNDRVNGQSPCTFKLGKGIEPWKVDNYEGSHGGVVKLREATYRSLNCAYARLVQALGPEKVVEMARRLGVKSRLDPVLSITLGAEEVTPLDMATVVSTLADDGVHHDPVFVRRIETGDGHVLFRERRDGTRAVSVEVARTETDVLQDVVRKGTGTRAGIGRAAAGKTGTSQEWRDAWFCGYTPQLAAVVWMGSPLGQVSMRGVGGVNVAGGTYPARIWSQFMRAALAGDVARSFIAPESSAWPKASTISEKGRGKPITGVRPTTTTGPGTLPTVPFGPLPPLPTTTRPTVTTTRPASTTTTALPKKGGRGP
jgi:penicillin-binding protein 1A